MSTPDIEKSSIDSFSLLTLVVVGLLGAVNGGVVVVAAAAVVRPWPVDVARL